MMERRTFLTGASALAAASCASAPRRANFAVPPPLVPLNLAPEHLTRITVCTRPFRGSGPRVEIEAGAGKPVVHNYGHGGSGWSLAWGCAEEAAALALEAASRSTPDIAVIGAGVIGLTTALRLAESGASVAIYADEFPAETRSARASGVWSPASRVALSSDAPSGFCERWERWARTAYAAHQRFVGRLGEPVVYLRRYSLRDEERAPRQPAQRDFFEEGRTLRGLTGPWRALDPGEHPFPVDHARSGLHMTFNVATYAQILQRDFLLRGGRMRRRKFSNLADCLALDADVIVNCSGYGARRLCDDEEIRPVRGQLAWFAPQPQARYGVYYRGVTAVSRRDGIVVQDLGCNQDYGFGDATEIADPQEAERAAATLRPLFEKGL